MDIPARGRLLFSSNMTREHLYSVVAEADWRLDTVTALSEIRSDGILWRHDALEKHTTLQSFCEVARVGFILSSFEKENTTPTKVRAHL